MGARGPKPRPTAAKIAAGERRDRINDDAPELPAEVPEAPAELTPAAAAEWARIAAELAPMRVLTRADRAALQLYCEAFAQWSDAAARLKKTGMVTRTGAGGFRLNPYAQIAQAAAERMIRLLAEFGGTPSSRGRLKVADANQADPADEILDFLHQTG